MGKSLTRPEVTRKQVRIACDKHGSWRREQQARQAQEEAESRAAEEKERAAKMQQIRTLAQKNRGREGAFGAGSGGSEDKGASGERTPAKSKEVAG